MLKLTGNVGKSVIVDAIKKYNNARVYSYDKELIPVMESYHVDSNEYSADEFCKFVYENMSSLNAENFPISIVVIYTNLQEEINTIESLACILEAKQLAGMVIVTSR
ncbi:hypothetical protein [Mediterraneibacter gnavus]|uniref:hypothetical protein n=1 Tax=Mediterraneibacter gnavus TaxID=33038 RepID=UPI0004644752|nr:hypothetical protein [Mediterraneibacter gnavus]